MVRNGDLCLNNIIYRSLNCVEEKLIIKCVCCIFDESKIDIRECSDRRKVNLGWFMITIPVLEVLSIFITTYSIGWKISMLMNDGILL